MTLRLEWLTANELADNPDNWRPPNSSDGRPGRTRSANILTTLRYVCCTAGARFREFELCLNYETSLRLAPMSAENINPVGEESGLKRSYPLF